MKRSKLTEPHLHNKKDVKIENQLTPLNCFTLQFHAALMRL
ncbi:hypothetical protein PsalN5692_02900 [Piscirickettsia salmonis]|nr:hypothetical protein A0O36_02573 [Piscirickettsiaceae bacterium NZ-RLO1]QGP51417.1 hypothetical protein PsalN5692_02900 [Piscirickettsia salmonis]